MIYEMPVLWNESSDFIESISLKWCVIVRDRYKFDAFISRFTYELSDKIQLWTFIRPQSMKITILRLIFLIVWKEEFLSFSNSMLGFVGGTSGFFSSIENFQMLDFMLWQVCVFSVDERIGIHRMDWKVSSTIGGPELRLPSLSPILCGLVTKGSRLSILDQ